MSPIIIAGLSLLILLSLGYLFLYLFNRKLSLLESYIIRSFQSRTDTIPSIYEISKHHLTKHNDIFRECLRLRKTELSLLENKTPLYNMLDVESKIHHEVRFIFQVCNKHPKLLKNGNFIYIRENVIQKSTRLGEVIELYRSMIQKYNTFIKIKNYSVIGLLLPISPKIEI